MDKYGTRAHSWNEERSCIYLTGDPEQRPVISGMEKKIAEGLAEVLNRSRDLEANALVGERLRRFENESFGRNTWRTKDEPDDLSALSALLDAFDIDRSRRDEALRMLAEMRRPEETVVLAEGTVEFQPPSAWEISQGDHDGPIV